MNKENSIDKKTTSRHKVRDWLTAGAIAVIIAGGSSCTKATADSQEGTAQKGTANEITATLQETSPKDNSTYDATAHFLGKETSSTDEENQGEDIEWGGESDAQIAQKFAKDAGITPNPKFDNIVAKARAKLGERSYQQTIKTFWHISDKENWLTEKQQQYIFYMIMELLANEYTDPTIEDLDNCIEIFWIDLFWNGEIDYFYFANKIHLATLGYIKDEKNIAIAKVENVKLLLDYYQNVKKENDQAKKKFIISLEKRLQRDGKDAPKELLQIKKEAQEAGRYKL